MSELTLQRYAASMSHRVSYRTLKVYLAGIQYWYTIAGYQSSIASMPQLFYLFRGIRRSQGHTFIRPRRLPITSMQLRVIHYCLQYLRYSHLERTMFHAASTLAFFGLLRSSESTSSHHTTFNPQNTLLVSDITFNQDRSIMFVLIRASKTDPFRSGCVVRVAAIDDSLCPVRAMSGYLSAHPTHSGPLFVLSASQFLLRQDMVLLLRRCLSHVSNINTHSFRIGGASTAALAGISDSHIQILGRWSSDAYRRYLHISDTLVGQLCQALVTPSTHTRVWDSTLGRSSVGDP